jgi:hypothetical protein
MAAIKFREQKPVRTCTKTYASYRSFKKYLAEAYSQYGVAGAPAVTESMPGNMVFDPKTKEYTYKPTK